MALTTNSLIGMALENAMVGEGKVMESFHINIKSNVKMAIIVNIFLDLEENFQFGKLFRFLFVYLQQNYVVWNKRI